MHKFKYALYYNLKDMGETSLVRINDNRHCPVPILFC